VIDFSRDVSKASSVNAKAMLPRPSAIEGLGKMQPNINTSFFEFLLFLLHLLTYSCGSTMGHACTHDRVQTHLEAKMNRYAYVKARALNAKTNDKKFGLKAKSKALDFSGNIAFHRMVTVA